MQKKKKEEEERDIVTGLDLIKTLAYFVLCGNINRGWERINS